MTSSESSPKTADKLTAALLLLLPTRLISYLTYRLAHLKTPWIKTPLNQLFIWLYNVDLAQAERRDPKQYASFNDLFTRALCPQARPLPKSHTTIISPCDGTISAIGQLSSNQLIQAKGVTYSMAELMGALHEPRLINGMFITIYLSPRDYHRIHAPIQGKLIACQHIPGRLLTVSPAAVRAIPKLYVRNERLVTIWQTQVGPIAIIPIGALNVGSIETVWASELCQNDNKAFSPLHEQPSASHGNHSSNAISSRSDKPVYVHELSRGDELGRFNLGSTVIMILPQGKVSWQPDLEAGSQVLMGQALGEP